MKRKIILLFSLFLTLGFYASHAGKLYLDFSEMNFSNKPDQKINQLSSMIEENAEGVRAIGLSSNDLNSHVFNKLTKVIFKNNTKLNNLKILNLEDNYLDENASSALAKWLQLEAQPYINVSDNPISLKNVKDLYSAFRERYSLDETQEFMRRIIFMSKGYVNKAKKIVKVYKDFENRGIIPSNWDDTHRKFYNMNAYISLIAQKEENKRYKVLTKMKTTADESPRKVKLTEVAFEGDEEEETLPESLLIEALSNLSIDNVHKQ